MKLLKEIANINLFKPKNRSIRLGLGEKKVVLVFLVILVSIIQFVIIGKIDSRLQKKMVGKDFEND